MKPDKTNKTILLALLLLDLLCLAWLGYVSIYVY
jgi:hypothetical protein